MSNPVLKNHETSDNSAIKLRRLSKELSAVKREQHQLRQDLNRIHNSLSWKLTRPLRTLNAYLQRKGVPIAKMRFAIGRLQDSIRSQGVIKTATRLISLLRSGKLRALVGLGRSSLLELANQDSNKSLTAFYPTTRTPDASHILVPRVVIVAEMSIPQCKKYRVVQKAELFGRIGIESVFVDWTQSEKVRALLQTHPVVIFYRVPAVPEVVSLVKEAKRLGSYTFWEVDDLIFDPDGYLSNKNLDTLDPDVRKNVLSGMKLYREALLLCDSSIGSTRTLARVMSETTGKSAYVIENALDSETIKAARNVRSRIRSTLNRNPDRVVTIVYGSGTKTHDIDFLSASSAIYNILSKRQNVRLRIIGELTIESRFDEFSDQIERLPFTSFDGYLESIATSDISIAPLEDTVFNDAKSNIKYLEASILGLPSVCSPSDAFKSAIIDGERGFLASSPEQWETKLLDLIDSPDLRQTIAKNAHKYVCRHYSPNSIAKRQVQPLINGFCNRDDKVTRILLANVFFSPQSFGGATVVAEEMARILAGRKNVEVYVFTSWPHSGAPDYGIVRYSALGANVFAVKVPTIRDQFMDLDDELMGEVFEEVLKAIRPDVVHLHSIQTLGVKLGSVCRAYNTPYAITLHDAWWLCERQFMVTSANKYCFQTKIDPSVCAVCVPDKEFNQFRTGLLRSEMLDANGLIAPSIYFKNLHIANGLPADKIFVNKNGIAPPSKNYKKQPSDLLRFGYVGGSTPIKGFDLVKAAFSSLPPCMCELVLVDNTLNQGYSSVSSRDIKAQNPIRVVPAYTQEDINEFFSDIDVLLFPTQWKESFGLTVREALIRDIWVIASDAGGVIEDIVDGVNGKIIPISTNSIHLKDAMASIIKDRQKLNGYVNPFKMNIQTFAGQADELYDYLISLADSQEKIKQDDYELSSVTG